MIVLSVLFLEWGWARPDEARLVRLTELVRPIAPLAATAPPAEETAEILFVNVAYELEIVERTDSLGIPVGERAITDRATLAELLERLHRLGDPQRAVVMDVAFVDMSPNDPRLRRAFEQTPTLLVAEELGPDGQPLPTVLPAAAGVTAFPRQNQTIVKFQRTWDGLPTLSDRMFSTLHPELYEARAQARWSRATRLNTHLLTHRICPPGAPRCVPASDRPDAAASHLDLSLLLALPDDLLASYARDRILLLGDYVDHDIHLTAVGDLPGSVVVANAYLGLVAGDDVVGWPLVAVLWVAFTLLSYGVFSEWRGRTWQWRARFALQRWGVKAQAANRAATWLGTWLSLAWIPLSLLVLSLLTSLYAGVHLQVLAMTAYLALIVGTQRWIRLARSIRREAQARALSKARVAEWTS